MADFCKQCSLFLFDEDFHDLASLDYEAEEVHFYAICEGCGFTVVNKQGECIGMCFKKHGTLPVQTPAQFLRKELPSES